MSFSPAASQLIQRDQAKPAGPAKPGTRRWPPGEGRMTQLMGIGIKERHQVLQRRLHKLLSGIGGGLFSSKI